MLKLLNNNLYFNNNFLKQNHLLNIISLKTLKSELSINSTSNDNIKQYQRNC